MKKKTKTIAFIKSKIPTRQVLLSAFTLFVLFSTTLLQPVLAYSSEPSDELLSASEAADTEPEPPSSWEKWLYYDRGDHISVCGYTGVSGDITIPGKIDGKPVTEISARNTGTDKNPKYEFFEGYNGTLTSITVPEGVLSIAPNAFSDSFILGRITLPESLKVIGNRAFARCQQLTSLSVPENVVMIGKEAFALTGLTEITLPQGLKVIGEGAFKSSHLTKISIPDSVIYMGREVFYSTLIEEIKLPAGLKKLGSNLLSGCTRLRRVYISEGTEVTAPLVFETCPTLEEVYFPSTLKVIDAAFISNLNLKNLYFAADEEETKLTLGNDIMSMLIDDRHLAYYENVRITYNTPVPVIEEMEPKKPLKLDVMTITLIAASTVLLILSVIFLTGFIRERKQTEAAKTEEAKREEAFHPEVLGAWECGKCKTLNGPIGKYCYKCGRKR